MSTSWPSSSAGERKADYLSQQRMGQHCGNSRQIGSNWGRGERGRKWEGPFQLSGVKICCSFHLFSVRSPRSPPRALSEGVPWFHRGSVSGVFGHIWQSASCNNVSYKKPQEQPSVSVIGFITLKFPSQLRSLFWVCQEKWIKRMTRIKAKRQDAQRKLSAGWKILLISICGHLSNS